MNNFYKSVILISFLVFIGISYYKYRTNTYITAEFKNLRPFHYSAPIYYNGYKIGKVVKVSPNRTYTSTIVTMELHPQDMKFPINILANLKKEKNRFDKKFDYIEIVYPQKPSPYFIKDGDKIAGKTTIEFESFWANQEPESLEAMRFEISETLRNLNITVQTLGDLFMTLNSMVEEIRPNIVKASFDLEKSTTNLITISEKVGAMTSDFSEVLDREKLDSTAENTQLVTHNIKVFTDELNKIFPDINCTIDEINKILCNIDEMTTGLNCTMKKPFGGLRLIFGQPVNNNCNCK